ncbi:hypothetical protein DY000_02008366 [Brassica cretica]|uniref:DET1- and DDB1-associated protein 1 n=1 Tax=Brassica cretica TaxID=69181 RepID=A0ABQ7BX23_BRACR|nr:hypothetical protein DY000_02008366 [Brassica cretica]
MYVKFLKMQECNTENQKKKKHTMPHVCGRKSFSRRRNEIVNIYLFFDYLEALTTLLSQSPHSTKNVTASLDDEYAQVFGPECPRKVRCVYRGPTDAPQSVEPAPHGNQKVPINST